MTGGVPPPDICAAADTDAAEAICERADAQCPCDVAGGIHAEAVPPLVRPIHCLSECPTPRHVAGDADCRHSQQSRQDQAAEHGWRNRRVTSTTDPLSYPLQCVSPIRLIPIFVPFVNRPPFPNFLRTPGLVDVVHRK